MTAIAISMLFGLAAFFSLLTIYLSLMFGTARGISILREIALIDGYYGKGRKVTRSGRSREEAFPPLWSQPSADA